VDSVLVEFSEDVTGVDIYDFTLTRNGTLVLDLYSFASLTPLSPSSYELDLSDPHVTGWGGEYVLTLDAAGSGIQDLAGNELLSGDSDGWTMNVTNIWSYGSTGHIIVAIEDNAPGGQDETLAIGVSGADLVITSEDVVLLALSVAATQVNDHRVEVPLAYFHEIEFSGRGGDDTYGLALLGKPARVNDSSGSDTLDFSSASQGVTVDLSNAADQVIAPGNTLTITGTIETCIGTDFDDTITGNDTDNSLDGGDGNDTLNGALGNDMLAGRAGNDSLDGGAGEDNLFGGMGDDTLLGREGGDQLYGRRGADFLAGHAGHDLLHGEEDGDSLLGGAGVDTLYGGDGDDCLRGHCRGDFLYGGSGDDDLFGNDGGDLLFGMSGNDTIRAGSGNDYVAGNVGDDVLYGEDGDDRLRGGFGADVLTGNVGSDVLLGMADDDNVFGGAGRDLLIGGLGLDALFGRTEDDILIGDTTTHDANDEALLAFLDEWNEDTLIDTRIDHLEGGGGLNDPYLLNRAALVEDGELDRLTGEEDADWFLSEDPAQWLDHGAADRP
jgi:Ca2+-binding RTX toxin-like protein